MTSHSIVQLTLFVLLVAALTKPLGVYVFRVFEGATQPLPRLLGPLERALLRVCGVDRQKEQTWGQYATALLLFSAFGILVVFVLLRLQGALPGNPLARGGVEPALAFNTATSFVTNTNWQSYSGESTMTLFSQMGALAWQNFVSAAAGIAVALAVARGLTRRAGPEGQKTLGNFWVDLVRGVLYILLPLSVVLALFFVSQGVVQTLDASVTATTLEGAEQQLALGPVASQLAIKMLGTNGGGFFNANSAHPFENPTAVVNFVQMVLIFCIPAALTYTYGRMAGDQKQGWALFGAMLVLFVAGAIATTFAEAQNNPALAGLPLTEGLGNLEGKETRFGTAASALFAAITTAASCGAVNAMLDSFTPLGGLVPLLNIQLGEVVFGGVGAGLYGILVFVLLSVFIAGLMVGRTPEYLGKKVEAPQMKLAMLYLLIFPLVVLGLSAFAAVQKVGTATLGNAGPHGLSEILYAYSSAAGNNGSAFAGLEANNTFWNVSLGIAMLIGRFLMIVPVLALAGSMVGKKIVPAGPGTFPTGGALFAGLLTAVIVIVGALTFFPALCLGPIVEHFVAQAGQRY